MKCPRCGAENTIPEATKHRCLNCGYSLIGEVSKHDAHAVAARRNALRFFAVLTVLGGLVYAVIVTDWFGLRSGSFTPSDAPLVTSLFAPDPIDVPTPNGTVVLRPTATFSVNVMVLANQRYADGPLLQISERDLIVAWGEIAAGDRKRVQVVPHDRSATLTSPDGQFETNQLTSLIATLHVIPANDSINRVLQNLSGGAKIGLEGLIVNTTLNGQNISGLTEGGEEGESRGFLLYVTSVTLRGKTVGLTVTE